MAFFQATAVEVSNVTARAQLNNENIHSSLMRLSTLWLSKDHMATPKMATDATGTGNESFDEIERLGRAFAQKREYFSSKIVSCSFLLLFFFFFCENILCFSV